MGQVNLTRRYRFVASHRLHSDELSAEANRETYGKCNNPYGHGHNYTVDVTVRGHVGENGLVVELPRLDAYVQERVISEYDHRDLTIHADYRQLVSTTENVALVIERRLREQWPEQIRAALAKVVVHETRNNIFEVRSS